MKTDIGKWVNLKSYPLSSIDFVNKCHQKLSDTGVLLLPKFLLSAQDINTLSFINKPLSLGWNHNLLLIINQS